MTVAPRPCSLALALALLPAAASADDLVQAYELARAGDPQFAAAEARRIATKEGVVQARAALLPQITADVASASRRPAAAATVVARPRRRVNSHRIRQQHPQLRRQRAPDDLRPQQLHPPRRQQRARARPATSSSIGRRRPDHAHRRRLLQRADRDRVARRRRAAESRGEAPVRPRRQAPGSRPGADHRRARSPRPLRQRARQHHPGAQRARRRLPGAGRDHRPAVRNLKGLPEDFRPTCTDPATPTTGCRSRSPTTRRCGPRSCRSPRPKDVQTARAGHYPTLSSTAATATHAAGATAPATVRPVRAARQRQHRPVPRPDPVGADLRRRRHPVAACARPWPSATRRRPARAAEARAGCATRATPIRRSSPASAKSRRAAWPLVSAQSGVRRLAGRPGSRHPHRARRADQAAATCSARSSITRSTRYNFLQNRLLLEQAAGTLDIDDVQDINRLLTVNAEASVANAASAVTRSRR